MFKVLQCFSLVCKIIMQASWDSVHSKFLKPWPDLYWCSGGLTVHVNIGRKNDYKSSLEQQCYWC